MPTWGDMKILAHEVIRSYEARAGRVASIRNEVTAQQRLTRTQLQELYKDHQAMARQQRVDLAKVRTDLTRAGTQRRSQVNAWMTQVATAHHAVGQRLRAYLSNERGDLIRAEAQGKAQVNSWIKEAVTAHATARKEWQDLAIAMQAKRGGATVVAEAPPGMAPAPPAVEEVAPAAAVEEAALRKRRR